MLVITADKESFTGPDGVSRAYTSCRLNTAKKFSQVTGTNQRGADAGKRLALYFELLADSEDEQRAGTPAERAARVISKGDAWLLEAWAQPLTLGQALPTLPLWLADNLAVPLDLEGSYEETCRVLRIP